MNGSTAGALDNELLFVDEEFSDNYSTELPPEIDSQVVTIVIVALAVIITIVLLFGLAVFIDCRHQKLSENGKRDSERRLFNFEIPKFLQFRRFSNDEDSFVDKMYAEENAIA